MPCSASQGGGIGRAADTSPQEHHGAELRGARLGSATVTPGDSLRDGRNRSPAAEPAALTPACFPPLPSPHLPAVPS